MNKIFKLFFKSLMLSLLINSVYSQVYFSEINFLDNEFIEIYSDENINLSNLKLFDEKGINYSNNLKKVSLKKSNYYLIVGEDFLTKYHTKLNNFNCSIFKTEKNNLGYRGLKNEGENITLLLDLKNLTKNIKFVKNNNYKFKENQSLNYDIKNQNFKISKFSICNENSINSNNNSNSNNNNSNNSNNNNNNNANENNFKFENVYNKTFKIESINLNENKICENKIQFKFNTDAINYLIKYWITKYNGKIVKNLRNTSNCNIKIYTPSSNNTEIYKINGKLFLKNKEGKINQSIFKFINKTIVYTNVNFNSLNYNNSNDLNEQNNNNNNNKNNDENDKKCYINIKFPDDKNVFTDKIKFKFEVPHKNYTIKYELRDFNGQIVKKTKITSNDNTKTFTPKIKQNEVYEIITQYNSSNCLINNSKFVFFHESNPRNLSNLENNEISYIRILNKKELSNFSSEMLKFEIFKGDTRKRTVKIYQNNKIIFSKNLDKYEKYNGNLKLNLSKFETNIKIEGLGAYDNLTINNGKYKVKENKKINLDDNKNNSIKKKKLVNKAEIKIINVNNKEVKFKLSKNIDWKQYEGSCYINFIKTKISNIIKINKDDDDENNNILIINITKLLKKQNQKNYNLTVNCKYKKIKLKTWKYLKQNFEFKIGIDGILNLININNNLKNKTNNSKINKTKNNLNVKKIKVINFFKQNNNLETKKLEFQEFENKDNNNLFMKPNNTFKFNQSLIKEELRDLNIQDNFKSKNSLLKKNSFFLVFVGVCLIFIMFLIKW